MKLKDAKIYVKKFNRVKTNTPKTAFLFIEDNPANAVDFMAVKPFGIKYIIEPRFDDRGRLIKDEYKVNSKLSTSEEIEVLDMRRLGTALKRNKPIAINLNPIFKAAEKDKKKFNWKNAPLIERINSAIDTIAQKCKDYDYETVIVYSIDMTLEHPNLIPNSRIFPIIWKLKDAESKSETIDYLMLTNINEDRSTKHIILYDHGVFNYKRAFALVSRYIRKAKSVDSSKEVSDDMSRTISSESDRVVFDLQKLTGAGDVDIKRIIMSNRNEIDKAKAITTLTIMKQAVASSSEINRFVGDVVDKNIESEKIENYSNKYKEFTLKYEKPIDPKIISDSVHNSVMSAAAKAANKDIDVSQMKNRRQAEMDQIFMSDIKKVVNELALKNDGFELKNIRVKKVDAPTSKDIRNTQEEEIRITYENFAGNENTIIFKIPKLINGMYFRHYGQKKALMYQVIPDIVTKPKPDVVRIATNYSVIKITKKGKAAKNYFQIYIGGQKMPVALPLAYWIGTDALLKAMGIEFTVHNEKETKDDLFINGKYYSVYPNDEGQYGIVNGLKRVLKKNEDDLASFEADTDQEFYENLLKETFGSARMLLILQNIRQNFMDPITKDIAIQKNIPITLPAILIYGVNYLERAPVTRLTDLTKSRLRYSEVMVQSISKILQASYNDYKSRAAVGDESAQIFVDPNIVIKDLQQSTLLTIVETVNPIEEIQTLTRFKPMGPGGIPSKAAVTLAVRNLDKTYYGIVDPADTPESDSIGISQQFVVSQDLSNSRGFFPQYSSSNKNQIFGIGSALTPFAKHDDTNRLQMAANQIRQAIPLQNPQPPVVQTGYENVVREMLSNSFVKKSPVNGTIVEIVAKSKIVVKGTDGKLHSIPINPMKLHSGSGKSAGSIFNPKIKVGDKVIVDQILAEGSHIKDGILSMGRTLLTALMPYSGFTYEDSLCISQRLADEHELTSIHVLEYEFFFDENLELETLSAIGDKLNSGSPLIIFKKAGGEGLFLEPDEYDDNDNDSLDIVEDISTKTILSPNCVVEAIEIYSNKDIADEFKQYQVGGIGGHTYKGNPFVGSYLLVRVSQILPITAGDKLCNRHGNKGVISRVVPTELMPTWRGNPIDIIYNPLSVVGRMNMGQILEMYLGLCCKELGIKVLESKKNKVKVMKYITDFYTAIDATKDKRISKVVINGYNKVINSNYSKFINELEAGKDFTSLAPQFEECKIEDIQIAMKQLGLKEAYTIDLPEIGVKTVRPVAIGYQTWYKLEHIVENKIHARSTGAVQANLQGVAGKKRGGAAKLGELDVSALISYNATTFLKEAFTLSSDDHGQKNQVINDIIQNGEAHLPDEAPTSPSKEILANYMIGMQLKVAGLHDDF